MNCPDDVTIKIYDILGDKIKELSSPNAENKILWNVKDSGGRSLARGMYMAILKNSQGKKRTIKFLIHR